MNAKVSAPFRLTRADADSNTWRKLEKHLAERLDRLRKDNDNTGLDERSTSVLRGRIAEVKAILDLAKDLPNLTPVQESEQDD